MSNDYEEKKIWQNYGNDNIECEAGQLNWFESMLKIQLKIEMITIIWINIVTYILYWEGNIIMWNVKHGREKKNSISISGLW